MAVPVVFGALLLIEGVALVILAFKIKMADATRVFVESRDPQ